MRLIPLILIAAIPRLIAGQAAAAEDREISGSEFVLDTVCSIRIYQGGSRSLLDESFARLRGIGEALSTHEPDSEISRVNAKAGISPVRVGADAIAIIERDLEYSRLTEGAFDPSIGPLVLLWGIGTESARVPATDEIRAALGSVGWKDIVLDAAAKTLFLRRKGMALDLGSATKGYAADIVGGILRAGGVKKAVIDLGGNVLVLGSRVDGKPWRIGLQNPFDRRGALLGVASLVDESMVTSGVYERYFEKDGKRYHHILDTRTGFPVENGLVSATVIAPKSFDADGLTTAIFALGRERGMELAKRRGVGAILVDSKRKVYMSPGMSRKFKITNPAFSYAE